MSGVRECLSSVRAFDVPGTVPSNAQNPSCEENGRMKELSLKQNLIWNTAGCLTYQGCQWLTTILVVTLSASYENSGILAFAMATGNVYFGLATYNMRTFQVSDVRGEFSSGNYVGFRFVTILAASVLCAAYSLVVSPSVTTAVSTLAFLLFKADESFANVLYGIDQRGNRMDYIGISQAVRGVLTIVAFSGSLVLFDSLTVAFVAMFVCCVCVTLVYDIPHAKRLEPVAPHLGRAVCARLFKTCAPAVAATFFYSAVATLARQWFGICYGEEQLGIYAAVATPCVLVQVAANYLYNPFLVPIARSWNAHDSASLRSQLAKLLTGIAAAIVVCLAGAALFGSSVLELIYGPSIADHSWLIVPAMVAAASMALASFLTDLFVVMRHFGCAVSVNAVALVACALLMTPCFQAWYMNGVNVVIAASFAIGIAAGLALLARSRKRQRTLCSARSGENADQTE